MTYARPHANGPRPKPVRMEELDWLAHKTEAKHLPAFQPARSQLAQGNQRHTAGTGWLRASHWCKDYRGLTARFYWCGEVWNDGLLFYGRIRLDGEQTARVGWWIAGRKDPYPFEEVELLMLADDEAYALVSKRHRPWVREQSSHTAWDWESPVYDDW